MHLCRLIQHEKFHRKLLEDEHMFNFFMKVLRIYDTVVTFWLLKYLRDCIIIMNMCVNALLFRKKIRHTLFFSTEIVIIFSTHDVDS